MFPQARREGLTIHELPEETLVYDRQRHRAHCLNRTAALVWKECDGRTSVPQLAETLRRIVGAPVDEAVVRLALGELARAHLLEPLAEERAEERHWSRRDLVRKLAAGALVLPAVLSITSPASAQHTSPGFIATGGATTGATAGGTTTGTTAGGTTVGVTAGGTTVGTVTGGTTVGTVTGGTTVVGGTTGGVPTGGISGGTTAATGVSGPGGSGVGTGGGGTTAPGGVTGGIGTGGGGTTVGLTTGG